MSCILTFRINVGFRLLDLVDREIWNVTNEGWLKMKYILYAFSDPIEIFDDFVEVVAGKCFLSLLIYLDYIIVHCIVRAVSTEQRDIRRGF